MTTWQQKKRRSTLDGSRTYSRNSEGCVGSIFRRFDRPRSKALPLLNRGRRSSARAEAPAAERHNNKVRPDLQCELTDRKPNPRAPPALWDLDLGIWDLGFLLLDFLVTSHQLRLRE